MSAANQHSVRDDFDALENALKWAWPGTDAELAPHLHTLTNIREELAELAADRDEGWRQHNKSEIARSRLVEQHEGAKRERDWWRQRYMLDVKPDAGQIARLDYEALGD